MRKSTVLEEAVIVMLAGFMIDIGYAVLLLITGAF